MEFDYHAVKPSRVLAPVRSVPGPPEWSPKICAWTSGDTEWGAKAEPKSEHAIERAAGKFNPKITSDQPPRTVAPQPEQKDDRVSAVDFCRAGYEFTKSNDWLELQQVVSQLSEVDPAFEKMRLIPIIHRHSRSKVWGLLALFGVGRDRYQSSPTTNQILLKRLNFIIKSIQNQAL